MVIGIPKVRFVTAVTAAGSVKFFASGVNFSKNTHFFVFLSLKLSKFSEIRGYKEVKSVNYWESVEVKSENITYYLK